MPPPFLGRVVAARNVVLCDMGTSSVKAPLCIRVFGATADSFAL